MTAAATRAEAGGEIVGKKVLAGTLGWSRPTLDKRLQTDPSFPVRKRGDQGGGWEFEVKAVLAYLKGEPAEPLVDEPAPPEPECEPEDNVRRFPMPARAQHQGEATARQMRDQADAELKFDRLRRMRGDLVEAAAVREVVQVLLVEMRSTLTGLPDMLVRDHGISERQAHAVRSKIEGTMRGLVAKLGVQLGVRSEDDA